MIFIIVAVLLFLVVAAVAVYVIIQRQKDASSDTSSNSSDTTASNAKLDASGSKTTTSGGSSTSSGGSNAAGSSYLKLENIDLTASGSRFKDMFGPGNILSDIDATECMALCDKPQSRCAGVRYSRVGGTCNQLIATSDPDYTLAIKDGSGGYIKFNGTRTKGQGQLGDSTDNISEDMCSTECTVKSTPGDATYCGAYLYQDAAPGLNKTKAITPTREKKCWQINGALPRNTSGIDTYLKKNYA